MKFEVNVTLNVQELGVIISALQLLDTGEELNIARNFGSAPSLHDRLKAIYDEMDQTSLGEQHDPICEPSF